MADEESGPRRPPSAGLHTPPPSSPVPQGTDNDVGRAHSETHERDTTLKSPPGTVRRLPCAAEPLTHPTDAEIEEMSAETLRQRLHEYISLTQRYATDTQAQAQREKEAAAALREQQDENARAQATIRTNAIQLRLQQLELTETLKRHQVDLDLLHRELDTVLKGGNPEVEAQRDRYNRLKARYSRLKSQAALMSHELGAIRERADGYQLASEHGLAALGIVASQMASSDRGVDDLLSPAPIASSTMDRKRRNSESTVVVEASPASTRRISQIHRHPRRKLEFG